MKQITIIIFSLFFVIDIAHAGPFGLHIGMKKSDLKFEQYEKIGYNIYRMKKVPKPHTAFKTYLLIFCPDDELCEIRAIGGIIPKGINYSVKDEFKKIETSLKKHYGKNLHFEKSWSYTVIWKTAYGSNLPKDLYSVSLEVIGLNNSEGFVFLCYESNKLKEHEAKIRAKDDSAL